MSAMKALLLMLLAISHVASAADPVPGSTYAPPVPLLWKVSDGDNALYLLGSFHLLKAGDYPLSPDVADAFAEAERLVFEIPPGQLDDPESRPRFMAAAGYDDARNLSTVLPPRVLEQLRRLVARQGGTIAQLEAYEPWFVNLSLLVGLSQSLGFSAELGLDQHLMARAEAAGKPTGGLETFDDQLRALDSTPMDEQITGLKDFLDRPQQMPGMLRELHQAWRDGDVARLDELTRVEMLAKTPETYRIVNVERNDAWVPQLQAMLEAPGGDDVLVVVGALHLLGADGVVEKLRGAGYEVERICSACEPVAAGD